MANHKATKKDIRQSDSRRERNRYYGKTTRNAIRNLLATTEKATAKEEPDQGYFYDRQARKTQYYS